MPEEGGAQLAGDLFRIAAALDPLNEEALYDVACGLAAGGESAPALDALERAVTQGFRDFEWMARDTDLDGVRTDPRFASITGGKATAATERAKPESR
jgi:hypothetical protein